MRLGNNPLLFTQGWNAPWCQGFVAMFDHLLDSLKVGEKSSRKKLKSMEMLEITCGDLLFMIVTVSSVGKEEGLSSPLTSGELEEI